MSITLTTATSYNNIQDNVLEYINRVNQYNEAVIITSPNKQNAVLISEDEWNDTVASLEIMNNRYLMQKIKDGEQSIKSNKSFKNIEEISKYVLN
jgi:PHD/YefM family antitoxin component YafN of YafNO toxin-antitoxin module